MAERYDPALDLCQATESALAESEERFRQMAEMTGEWLWEQDAEGYYVYSSIAVKQILGISQEQVIGKHYTEFLTDQDKAYQSDFADIHRPFYGLVNHLRHRDGHLVYTESTGLPIIDRGGKLVKWRGVDRDITARKHFEDALIESEKRTRSIIESSLSAIIIMDAYGLIIDWNSPAEKMFGWSGDEAIGRRVDELIIPKRFRKAFREGLQTFLKTGAGPLLRRLVEHVASRRDGGEFPVEFSVSPLQLGNTYIFSGFINDITARKAAERQIRDNQIALAITQNELNIAQKIQASLLPGEAIVTADFEVTGICLPADRVGGDYFDYFFRGEQCLDMVIADVSGHSIGPALFMVEARSTIRAHASRPGSPSETLRLLNNLLFADLNQADYFITLFYLQYHADTRKARFANAGHPKPLWLHAATGRCLPLAAEGLILGVNNDELFAEQELSLYPDDLLLFYTDGILEAENAHGEFFGMARLVELVTAHGPAPPQQIIEALLTGVRQFCQRDSFNDDITLMLFKCR